MTKTYYVYEWDLDRTTARYNPLGIGKNMTITGKAFATKKDATAYKPEDPDMITMICSKDLVIESDSNGAIKFTWYNAPDTPTFKGKSVLHNYLKFNSLGVKYDLYLGHRAS